MNEKEKDFDEVKETETETQNLEHMNIEQVRELNGVKYFFDTTGKNRDSIISTLQTFNQRVILISGGYENNISYDSVGNMLVEKAKHLILVGRTGSLVEPFLMRSLKGKNRGIDIRITHCPALRQAVDCAFLSARQGDMVVFSAAADGFDVFKDSGELRKMFIKYVSTL